MEKKIRIEIDLDDLTLEEIETFEEATGLGIEHLADGSRKSAKVVRVAAWIAARRQGYPEMTIEEAGRLKFGALEFTGASQAAEEAPAEVGPPTTPAEAPRAALVDLSAAAEAPSPDSQPGVAGTAS